MIIFDLETAPIDGADAYLDPVQPAKNLKDPAKVAADIEQREAERLEKMGLDWNLSRIVALAYAVTPLAQGVVHVCKSVSEEREALDDFWKASADRHRRRTFVGFNIHRFDLPFLIQRSRYLGVTYPQIDMRRYGNRQIVDLFQVLTFDDLQATSVMSRSLKSFARRFALPLELEDIDGREVPALVAAGEWEPVEAHCRRDLTTTVALARRLGIVPTLEEVESAAI